MEMEKPLRGAIACPECGCLFRGRYFEISGERGYRRRCPNGHTFKNPPKPVKVKPCPRCARIEDVEGMAISLSGECWDIMSEDRKEGLREDARAVQRFLKGEG
jgi:hypothetical protein